MFRRKFEVLTNLMIENGQCHEENKDIVIYGLSIGVEIMLNIISTMIIGVSLRMLTESLVFLIVFSLIRKCTGGYHCQNSINCYFVSIGVITIVLILVKYVPIQYITMISLLLLILSIPTILKLAPVETTSRKIDKLEYNYFRKKLIINLTIECILIVVFAVFKLYNYVFLIALSFFVIAFMLMLQIIITKM